MTEDQDMMNRRKFFRRATGSLSLLMAAVVGIPFLKNLFTVSSASGEGHFVEIASLDALPLNEPKRIMFTEQMKDAFLVEKSTSDVWVIKHSDTDVTAFSPVCPHLGCSYEYHADTRQFICPCHSSVFSQEGKVLGGPAPRGLDTLPQKLENGKLFIQWKRFEAGIPEKKSI